MGATNLTLFGPRFEKVLAVGAAGWPNPNPDLRLPCTLVVEGNPPGELITETVFADSEHDGYRSWLTAHGRRLPPGTP